MKQLSNLVGDAKKREGMVADCVQLVESEVRSKTGVSGFAVKAAFGLVKAIKPGILETTVDSLLDEFVEAIQSFYEQYQQQGEQGTLEAFLSGRANDMAEALLQITDRRAQRSSSKTMVKAYGKLRPKGKVHVEQAAPGVGRVLDKHVGSL
ncbi:MAG: hypothetical protein V1754_04020 [Pseudomonadota bacterium]